MTGKLCLFIRHMQDADRSVPEADCRGVSIYKKATYEKATSRVAAAWSNGRDVAPPPIRFKKSLTSQCVKATQRHITIFEYTNVSDIPFSIAEAIHGGRSTFESVH